MDADPEGRGIVVVGGGIIGLSIALQLVRRGAEPVTVVERALIGEGATAHATGGIRQQFSTEANVVLATRSMPFWAAFEDETGHPLDFRRHGYLFVHDDPGVLAGFEEAAVLQRKHGVDVQVLEPGDVDEVFPGIRTDDLAGATYSPEDGSASPADAVAGLAGAARALGVRIEQRTEFLDLLRDDDGRVRGVRTSEGELPAGAVVVATGPQARAVGRVCGVDVPVFPRSRQAFATGRIDGIHPGLPLTVDTGSGAYLHPEGDGTAVLGGSDRDTPDAEEAQVDWSRVERLAEALAHRFPRLEDLGVGRGWAGLREMTPDDNPIVGPVSAVPGLWLAAGFSGHGFMQAPAVGVAVAELMTGATSTVDVGALGLDRFDASGPGALETAVF